jgi:hypothetical protein
MGAWGLAKDTVKSFIADEAHGASIASYTLFALAPILLIIIAIAGLVLCGNGAVDGSLLRIDVGDAPGIAAATLIDDPSEVRIDGAEFAANYFQGGAHVHLVAILAIAPVEPVIAHAVAKRA